MEIELETGVILTLAKLAHIMALDSLYNHGFGYLI